MKRRILSVLVMVIVLVMLLVACGDKKDPVTTEKPDTPSTDSSSGGEVKPSVEPIRVGVVTTLSGSNSGHGEYAKEGAELAKKQINEAGGILGRPLEIIYEDNGETEQSYVNAAVKALSSDDVCAVYSNGYSSQIELVLPQAQKYGIPYIGGNSSHALLEKDYTYYWMLRLSDRYVSPAMVNACVELGMKNPAILHVTDSYGVGMADYVEQAIGEIEGMTVAARIGVGDNEQQFSPYLTQIMNSDADGIIAIQHQDQAALVMMQVDAMAIDLPLMGCSQYASALAIDTAGETANGWYSLADWTVQTNTETGKAFVDAYRAAYNRDPDMQSVTAYDSMYLLKDAIERAGSDDPDAINKVLGETKDLPGAMTTYTFQGDNSLGTTIFLVQTENLQGTLKGLVTR
ncbi:MAG: ABC transporter substrate-binding protein [Clostridiaceae bacterium]|nr:ABC transporter substrate-binding protein [Clostridiaceae bacterium]